MLFHLLLLLQNPGVERHLIVLQRLLLLLLTVLVMGGGGGDGGCHLGDCLLYTSDAADE